MRARLTDIQVTVRQVRDKAIMVADGTMEGKRERWYALPLSAIQVDPEEYEVGDEVTVTLSEELALEKELI